MVRRRRRSKKWISWLVFLVLIVVAGVVCYFVWDNYFREKEEVIEQTDVVTQEETEEKVEERTGEQGNDSDVVIVEEKKVVQYDGEDPNEQNELTGVITYAGVSGNALMVRVNINQYLAEGSCVLNLTSGGANIYSETVAIVSGPSTATCEGFDVPVSAVGSGKFNIGVELSSGGKTGVIYGEVSL